MPEDGGIKHENKTVGTEGEPSQRNNPRYAVSVFIPQTFIEEYRANEQQNRAFEKRRYRLEKLAFAVAAIYAAITFGLWRNAKVATQDATRQAIAAEAALRPWVSAVDAINIVEPLTLDFTQPNQTVLKYTLDIPLKNFGKSPATKVVPVGIMVWGPWKEIQTKLGALGKYQCGPDRYLDLMQQVAGGTFIPPDGQIFYPYPAAEGRFGQGMVLKQGTPVQFWLIVCVAYDNPNDTSPSNPHHTCTVERFRSDTHLGDIPATQGTMTGKFEILNGGCAS